MYKVVIVDDEPGALSVLTKMIGKFFDFSIIGTFSEADHLVEKMASLKPDILFLDIHLGEKSGMKIARDLYHSRCKTKIVIVSAHEEYAIQAFEYNIVDYILKPVSSERLNKCIHKIEKYETPPAEQEQTPVPEELDEEKVRFKTKHGFILVNPGEIVCLEADQMYTKVGLAGQTDRFLAQNMGKILSMIDQSSFFRISRSSVINIQYLREVNRTQRKCVLFDGTDEYELPISKSGMKNLDDFFDKNALSD
ncbi:LytR/AlgR family response regulator transcription factor [Marinilabilia sp.]